MQIWRLVEKYPFVSQALSALQGFSARTFPSSQLLALGRSWLLLPALSVPGVGSCVSRRCGRRQGLAIHTLPCRWHTSTLLFCCSCVPAVGLSFREMILFRQQKDGGLPACIRSVRGHKPVAPNCKSCWQLCSIAWTWVERQVSCGILGHWHTPRDYVLNQ